MRLEMIKGDAASASGLIVGPKDHAGGCHGNAEGEETSPAREVESNDMGTVASERVSRRKQNQALDIDCGHVGQPEGERTSVRMPDDDWGVQADADSERGDQFGQGVGTHVERPGERFGREDVEGDDAAVGGETLDQCGERVCGGQELVEKEKGRLRVRVRRFQFEILKADVRYGDAF